MSNDEFNTFQQSLPEPPKRNRLRIIAAGIAALAVVVILVGIFTGGRSGDTATAVGTTTTTTQPSTSTSTPTSTSRAEPTEEALSAGCAYYLDTVDTMIVTTQAAFTASSTAFHAAERLDSDALPLIEEATRLTDQVSPAIDAARAAISGCDDLAIVQAPLDLSTSAGEALDQGTVAAEALNPGSPSYQVDKFDRLVEQYNDDVDDYRRTVAVWQ